MKEDPSIVGQLSPRLVVYGVALLSLPDYARVLKVTVRAFPSGRAGSEVDHPGHDAAAERPSATGTHVTIVTRRSALPVGR